MSRLRFTEWGRREYTALLGCLFSAKVRHGSDVDRLTGALRQLYRGEVMPVSGGRTAIHLALAACRALHPDRNEVIVPTYVCPSAIDAIRRCELVSVATDIGDDLNLTVEATARAITPRTLAVLGIHMYACAAPMAALTDLCRAKSVYLIDDAAQGVGVPTGEGTMGDAGDVGIGSFGQSKSVVSLLGGLLIVNREELKKPLRNAVAALPDSTAGLRRIAWFVSRYAWQGFAARPAYLGGQLLKRLGIRTEFDEDAQHVDEAMANVSAAIALRQLATLDRRIAGKRRVLALYREHLPASVSLPQPGYATRAMVVLPPNADREQVRQRLSAHGVQTRLGYPWPLEGLDAETPYASSLLPRLVELPSGSTLSSSAIDRICHALAEILQGARKTADS